MEVKGTLMQILKSPYMFVFIKKQFPGNFAFLILRTLEISVEFVNFLKSRLIFIKVQSCKLYNKQIYDRFNTNNKNEIFAFISVLVLKLFSRKVFFTNRKRQYKLLKSGLLFKKIASFTGQLLQNYN